MKICSCKKEALAEIENYCLSEIESSQRMKESFNPADPYYKTYIEVEQSKITTLKRVINKISFIKG